MMRLDFGGNKIYEQEFIIAKIELLILGVDFLFHFDFSIDFKKRVLIENNMGKEIKGEESTEKGKNEGGQNRTEK